MNRFKKIFILLFGVMACMHGMCFTLVGLLLLAFAENYFLILLAVSVVGLGSNPNK